MSELTGKRIVIFVDEFYNEHEFWYPKHRMNEAGASVAVAAAKAKTTYRSKSGMEAVSDMAYEDVDPAGVDGLIIPGGYAPDHMRRHSACLDLVRTLNEQEKPIAFICHAGWVPISAGILKDRRCTSFIAIRDDMVNAGAVWEDMAVVVDGNLVSSRTPDDLGEFCKAFIGLVAP